MCAGREPEDAIQELQVSTTPQFERITLVLNLHAMCGELVGLVYHALNVASDGIVAIIVASRC